MKIRPPYKKVLLVACLGATALAGAAAAPPADEMLEEAAIPGAAIRERPRTWNRQPEPRAYTFYVARQTGTTQVMLSFLDIRPTQVRFRRESAARRLVLERTPPHLSKSPVRLHGDRLTGFNEMVIWAPFDLDDLVDEADGLPASIPFGAHAALVNLEHLRLRDTEAQTQISVTRGIFPQTRRCEDRFALIDDALDGLNRFVLVADSQAQCRRVERSRNGGDLLFADSVPAALRQAVLDLYGPIATGVANRLGNEPGLVYVASWPDSPRDGIRFERSWDRTSLLLFNGGQWQQGLDPQQRDALRTLFITEQIQRRFKQADRPGAFTRSAAHYLLALFTADQAGNTSRALAEALPGWISDCASQLRDQGDMARATPDSSSTACHTLVQFVYDAVARGQSAGRDTLYGTWRRLLDASFRRGESVASPEAFLDSSAEARRISRGLLDGSVDWTRFAAELDGLGVKLRVSQDGPGLSVGVLSLVHFDNPGR